MRAGAKRALFWAPRALCILFAAFLSVFALDVFSGSRGFWTTIVALLLHLVPAFMMVVVLVIAWRREWVGAAVFGTIAVLYDAWFVPRFPGAGFASYLFISGPLGLAGVLFLLNWIYRARLRTQQGGGDKTGGAVGKD